MIARLIAFVVLTSGLLGGLVLVLRPNEPTATRQSDSTTPGAQAAHSSPSPAVQEFSIQIESANVVSGPKVMKVMQGESVQIKISANVSDELHLHGYDRTIKLKPGHAAELSFTADKAGLFPIELHESETTVGVLEVSQR